MLEIHIKSIQFDDVCQVRCILSFGGSDDAILTKTSANVSDYLDTDRADAFVVGLLHYAMEHKYDIRSDVPISEDLYYNLEFHFIDAIAHEGSGLYRTRLRVTTIPVVKKKGGIVATGISCGVDCLHTIYVHEEVQIPSYKITHLGFYNVGSHQTGKGKEFDNYLYDGRFKLCQSFAEEYGYCFYTINSNIHEVIERQGGYSHICNHSYMAAFCILLLQKGISRYYYSAGYPYTDFRVNKSHKAEELDSAMYDLLTFYCISIGGMTVYSAGGNIKRIDKTRILATYKPAQKYLNVCVNEPHNDSTCFKCVRTLLSIDATGTIDDFKDVFDIEKYKINKPRYVRKMWFDAIFMHDEFCQEILPLYRRQITIPMRVISLAENWKQLVVKVLGR